MVDMYVPPNPCEAGRETPPHLPLPLPQTLHLSVLHHWPWVTGRLAGAYPVYRRRHTGPEIVESEWYSRRRIVFVSGPADRWSPFHLTRASLLDTTACATGPLRSVGVTRLQPYYGPGRRRLVLSLSRCFAGYRLYVVPCSTGFWVGRGRAPVAQHFLVTCCPCHPAEVTCRVMSICAIPCCLRPTKEGSGCEANFVEATYEFTCVAAQ